MDKHEKKLTKKQKLFCIYFVHTQNAREAAAKAGYKLFPEKKGIALLQRPEIISEIKRHISGEDNKSLSLCARAGYQRLAFGGIADAIRLLFTDQDFDTSQLDSMDLYNISDIKKPKGGGMEIKFFDRLKALECLERIENNSQQDAVCFFEALNQSASETFTQQKEQTD